MGKPGRYFKSIFKDEDRREKAWDLFVHWKNIYVLGESEIGFVRHFLGFQSLVVLGLGFDKYMEWIGVDISLPWWTVFFIPLLFGIKLGFYLCVGLFLDKVRIVDRNTKWHNKRNEMLMNIDKATTSLEGVK